MQNFRTEINISPNPQKLTYSSKILAIGSCFSENIAQQLKRRRFDIVGNPYGTVFNPVSIFKQLEYSVKNTPPLSEHYIENNGLWSHYDFHSKFSALSKIEVETKLKKEIGKNADRLKKTNTLIITLGSAYVYSLADSEYIVANCHKVNSTNFTKRLLSVDEIVSSFRRIYQHLNQVENIILTVSPVRHIKDSLTLNAVSKSTLRLACHQILYEFPHVKYFPAYEFQLDDLRDYRFYKQDMLHPNQTAKDYIFDKFADAYLEEETKPLVKQVLKLVTAASHRPFQTSSDNHQKFIKETISAMEALSSQVNFTELIAELKSQLIE